ncbi:MAG: hypothetical protein ACREMY_14480, partial [bacterium]
MGTGRMQKLSYAGRMIQTTRFQLGDDDMPWLEGNLDAVRKFLGRLGPPGKDASGVPLWSEVSGEEITALLQVYRTVQDRTSFDADAARRYIAAQNEHGELSRWQVAIVTPSKRNEDLPDVDLGIVEMGPVHAIARTRVIADPSSIGVLTNPARKSGRTRQGDEEIGLSDGQILAARQELSEGEHGSIRDALLAQRPTSDGLLTVYPISPYSVPRTKDRRRLFDDPQAGEPVIGLALAFPPSESAATIEYVLGSVAQQDE